MHTTEQIKNDAAAIADGICPETGRVLRDLSPEAIRAHADIVFPHGADAEKLRTDYGRRYRLINAYADQREKTAGSKS